MLDDIIVIAANGTLVCMSLSVGVIPLGAPFVFAGLAVFGAAYGTFCLVLAICCSAGVSLNGIVLSAYCTLICVAILSVYSDVLLH